MAGGQSKVGGEGHLAWDGANVYHSICEVGKGGMASVCLALLSGKAGFQKLVALKRPAGDLLHEPDLLTMFLDEARLAARLNHPNVVHTYEVGLRNGQPFIAMEFVDGQPLNRIRLIPELPLGLHLCIIADALLGLHHAHELRGFNGAELGVVHRDVSPQNVLVGYDGLAKLVDFGIAKAHTQLSQTRAGYVKGKIAYMPPEQILGEGLDRRADLFAVGVLLWEACAEQRLWPGVSARERVRLLQAGDIPPLTRLKPGLPAALDWMCRRALAFAPAQRYQNAVELENDLQRVLASSALHATRRDVAAFMRQHFHPQQTETRRLIESKLGHLNGEALPPYTHANAAVSGGRVGAGTLLLPPPPAPHSQDCAPARSSYDAGASGRAAFEFGRAPAPTSSSLPMPSGLPTPPLSELGPRSAPPRSSVHSWGRSAPPPPPTSEPHKPISSLWYAAAAALFVGGGLLVLHTAFPPAALSSAAGQARNSPGPARTEEAKPLPPTRSAPAPSLAPARQNVASDDQSRVRKPASSLASRTTSTRRAAPASTVAFAGVEPSAAPPASLVPVTNFGGRR